MYCLSNEQTQEIFKDVSEIQLEEIARLFNATIENLETSNRLIGWGNTPITKIENFCIRSHGLYELIPLITPLLIKLSLVFLVVLSFQLMYNLIPSGE